MVDRGLTPVPPLFKVGAGTHELRALGVQRPLGTRATRMENLPLLNSTGDDIHLDVQASLKATLKRGDGGPRKG